jgi:steroid delta-isomerase-like uncharacterized protein
MAETTTLTVKQLRTTILELFGAVNAHDLERAVGLFTEDAVWEGTGVAAPVVGNAAIAEVFGDWFRGFPDMHFPLEDVEIYRSVDGDRALASWTSMMTMDGPYGGFVATGRTAKSKGTCRYEFRDGRIAKHLIIFDEMDVSRQLGLLPADDSMGSRVLAGLQHLTTPIARRLRRH